MKHPDSDFVQKVIKTILQEGGFDSWTLTGIQFNVMTSSYTAGFAQKGTAKEIKVMSEIIDAIAHGDDPFKRRQIKKLLKASLLGVVE